MTPEYVEETVELGGHALTIVRPASADELIDEEAFDEEEFLPYWAELWPSGVALAEVVGALDLRGSRVLELGAGLGLPSLAAALRGAEVLATDWAEDAVELLRLNAERNRVTLRVERVRWDDPEPLLREAPWELVLGADLLYEQRNADAAARAAAAARQRTSCSPSRDGRSRRRSLERWEVETLADGVFRLRLR